MAIACIYRPKIDFPHTNTVAILRSTRHSGEFRDLVGVQQMYVYFAIVGLFGTAVAVLVRETGTVGAVETGG